ncbi:MAG: hypothetical protein ACOYOT_05605 [Bacteroidales bacterium]
MKKTIYILLLAALCCPTLLMSQAKENTSSNAKIDSIYNLQKKMYVESKTGPLSGKKFGVELNIARLLMADKVSSISGGFSLFGVDRHAEIAFPVYAQFATNSQEFSEFSIDCHYRYFLGEMQKGFYLSGFTRLVNLSGRLGDNELIYGYNNQNLGNGNETKLGIGIGLGYRIFSKKGLYWGTSVSLGRYIIGKNDRFVGSYFSLDDDSPMIFDVEMLKFGWAF